MSNKYYTPVCEDFFYGLDYQYKPINKEWTSYTFNEDRPVNVLYNVKEYPDLFRIKYTDREDIESLGWNFDDIAFWSLTQTDRYRLSYNFLINKVTIQEKNVLRNGSGDFEWIYVVYRATIKNKSELLRLLRILNIAD